MKLLLRIAPAVHIAIIRRTACFEASGGRQSPDNHTAASSGDSHPQLATPVLLSIHLEDSKLRHQTVVLKLRQDRTQDAFLST